MAVPYHTHQFTIPVATKAETGGITISDKVVVPSSLGTAAVLDETDLATASQGLLADTAVQPADLGALGKKDTINNNEWFGADLAVENGGTGASTASAARTALGVGTAGTRDDAYFVQPAQAEGATLPSGFFSTADLATALTAFAASGKNQISLPAGDLPVFSQELQDGDHIVLDLNRLTRAFMSSSTSPILSFYSLPVWIENVSSISSLGAKNLADAGNDASPNAVSTVVIAGARTVTKGQLLKIIADDDIPGAKHGDASSRCRIGEFVVVGEDSTGTTITLSSKLRETYTTNVRLFAVANASVTIIGGEGDYSSSIASASTVAPMIRLEGLVGSDISMFRSKKALGAGLQLVGCYATKLSFTHFQNHKNDPSTSNYGYGLDDIGSEGTSVIGVSGENLRHVVTTDGYQIATNQTGRNVHRYGRTRNLAITGSTASACSNAAFDTHDEVDGAAFSGLSVQGSYRGAGSEGSAYELRGRNVSLVGSNADGCQTGMHIRTQKNGRVESCSAVRCSQRAILVQPGTYDGTENIEATVDGGVYETKDAADGIGEVVRLEADAGKRTFVKLVGGVTIKASGDITALNQIIYLTERVDLEIDAIVDVSEATSSDVLGGIILVSDDTSTIKGKLKVVNNGSLSIARLITGSPGTAEIDLEVEWVGSAYPTSSTDNDPFASEGQSGTRLSGEIITPVGERNTKSSSSTPLNAATVRLKRRKEERFQQVISSGTGIRVGANALTLDLTNLKPGQLIDIKNESANVVQFASPVGFTLGPGAVASLLAKQTTPVTVQLLDVSFPFTGLVSQTVSFSPSARDAFALLCLNDTSGTQVVTLPDPSTLPAYTKLRFVQQNTGVWTFAAATGTLRSISNFTKTAGRWAVVDAQIIGSDWHIYGGLAA